MGRPSHTPAYRKIRSFERVCRARWGPEPMHEACPNGSLTMNRLHYLVHRADRGLVCTMCVRGSMAGSISIGRDGPIPRFAPGV